MQVQHDLRHGEEEEGNESVIKSWSAHHELRLIAHQFLSRFKMKRCVKQTLVHYIELLVTRQDKLFNGTYNV